MLLDRADEVITNKPLGIVASRDLRSPVIAREGNQVAVYGPCNSIKDCITAMGHQQKGSG
jgi:hypothetical protein